MFIIDDLYFAPFSGFMFIVKEVANAAQQELERNRDDLMAQLSALHLQFEKGEITEQEFDKREELLLEQIEASAESQ